MQTKVLPLPVLRLVFCGGLTGIAIVSIILWQANAGLNSYWLDGLSFPRELITQPYFLPIIFVCLSAIVSSFILPKKILASLQKDRKGTNPKFTVEIIRIAILETVGILGFILAMMSQRYLISLPFIAISIALILRPFGDKEAGHHLHKPEEFY